MINRRTTSNPPASGRNLRIIPLGGCEEVGRNMTVFEYGQDIIILDMGIQFPEEDMPGVDYVIPDVAYLKGKEKNIRGVIFSHGHLDHIGAAHILLDKLGNPPIIGRPLTIAIIKRRLEDARKGSSKKLKILYIKDLETKINLGAFTVSFFQVDHTIIDAVGTIIESPPSTVVHPGDWTIEHSPMAGRKEISYSHLAKLRRPTVLMLEALGSTNRNIPVTEEEMLKNLHALISQAQGRVIIATFSSQLQRIKQILEYAVKVNKKVAIDGYSMKLNVEIAKELGYIKTPKDSTISIERLGDYPENKVILICTGAQGEEMSVLPRIVTGNHRFIKIRKSDTIIFSSSIIPGNERAIQRLKDNLYRLSDNVYHSEIMDVHISGHSNIIDIEKAIRQIKADYFIPVYANHFMLKEAAKIAYKVGYTKDEVIVPDNGSVIEAGKGIRLLREKVQSNYVFVDGLGVGDVGEVVLRDRQMLSNDGMFVIVAIVDRQTGRIRGSPDIISRGFVYLRESKDLLAQTRRKVIEIVDKAAGSGGAINWVYIKDEIRNKIGDFLHSKTERRPMVLPVVIEV